MEDKGLQDGLTAQLEDISFMDAEDIDRFEIPGELAQIDRVQTFEAAGVLTSNAGLVVTMIDRSEFQVTIVKSR